LTLDGLKPTFIHILSGRQQPALNHGRLMPGTLRRPPETPLKLSAIVGRSPAIGRGDGWLVLLCVVGLLPLAVALVLAVRSDLEAHLGLVVALHLAVALALAGLLAAAMSLLQRIWRRLGQLRETAIELGSGDLSVRAQAEPLDEFGQLGLALNTMADRIGRLLQAQRDLLSGVSHELRSPLARVEVALELLRIELGPAQELQTGPEGEKRQVCLGLIEEIQEEVQLLEQHIARLLEAQRVGAEGALPRRAEVNIDALIAKVLHRERHRLQQAGWKVETDLRAGGAKLMGDENALDRALSTLVENAVQHASDGLADDGREIQRELRIESTQDDTGWVALRWLDRGPGLTVEQCQQVFEAFFRSDRSRSTRTGGTGLGLYLVRRITEAHGGTARAMPRPGGGLIVELRLPLMGSRREVQQTTRMSMKDLETTRGEAGEAPGQGAKNPPAA
jgi:two-component system OmpR family sensor kinase